MKSRFKGGISKEELISLDSYPFYPRFSPHVKHEESDLVVQLSDKYAIPKDNILRLILYVDYAYFWVRKGESPFLCRDPHGISGFELKPEPITSIAFKSKRTSIKIINPDIIDKLYSHFVKLYYQPKPTKDKKKRTSVKDIKKIATDIFKELTEKEKIGPHQAMYVIGYIFAYYGIGLKYNNPIVSEEIYKKTHYRGNYLTYLKDNIKNYIQVPTIQK
jgi:hypothetical protein